MKKIYTQFDISEMMNVYTNHQNYEIIDFTNDDDHCIIFFSSNGLYYPNDSKTFHEIILKNNRFEWKRNIPLCVKRVIFLRDVTKQWYWEGINVNINTIEKLAQFLRAHIWFKNNLCR